jgi:hypothetical protein
MTAPSLGDAEDKLAWGLGHLQRLRAEHKTKLGFDLDSADPQSIKTDVRCRREDGALIFSMVLFEIPDDWGLILGDAFHNMRSALDVLACQLVELNEGTVTKRTAFPIYATAPTQRQRQRIKDNLKGMADEHAQRIRALQPYRDPDKRRAWALELLAELNNLDKHQIINPVYAYADPEAVLRNLSASVTFDPAPASESEVSVVPLLPIGEPVDGALDILRVECPPRVAVTPSWSHPIRIVFGADDVTMDHLIALHEQIVGVVKSFGSDFS